ncbi:hypothetical protein [Sphaerisporangium sp. TRM90804]|uniref:hypothetical protein n=1 Tax=Sphaerisporangium sp. TRM90804 TaxID=3031113 RepID=UPI002449237F|nr:hypothetical protein [Sphaerisporangium sp. TRM90804]MDH2426244.1 hypothetical protein [Sphaerisporangium sp. TRM90804]
MSERLDELEERISALRGEIRRAVRARESALTRSLRADLRTAERAWDLALAAHEPPSPGEPHDSRAGGGASARGRGAGPPPGREPEAGGGAGPMLPVRERVHQALTLLGVPSAARMLVAVHGALRAGPLKGTQLASLRRDEERSFRSSPFARPYYLCAALTDRLSASRGLFAVSTWPLERRVVGPLSARVDFLTSAVRVAEHVQRISGPGGEAPPAARRLLARMAQSIPGAVPAGSGFPGAEAVARAARAELDVHAADDAAARAEIARACERLTDAERLFGGTILSLAAAGRPGAERET